MQTTERNGSYGFWYTSRTSSIAATNPAPTFSMYHFFTSHGLSSFFSSCRIRCCLRYSLQPPSGSAHLRSLALSSANAHLVHSSRRSYISSLPHPPSLCAACSVASSAQGLLPSLPLQNVLQHLQQSHGWPRKLLVYGHMSSQHYTASDPVLTISMRVLSGSLSHLFVSVCVILGSHYLSMSQYNGSYQCSSKYLFHKIWQYLKRMESAKTNWIQYYCPYLNPIENFWSWLKRKLKEILSDYSSFDDALYASFQFY